LPTRDAKQKHEELEQAFGALAHAARRQILLAIWFRGGSLSAGDIAARFSHSWPTTSRHLKVLVDAGLLAVERDGRSRVYRVATERLDAIKEWLAWFSPDRIHR
jgi:DNA-binding transcriptional ArsR family regulator